MPKDDSLKAHIANLQYTKKTFITTERLLRTAKFSGAECEQVAQCIALSRMMAKQVEGDIQEASKQARSKDTPVTPPTPAPVDSTLGPHLPDAEEKSE